LKLHANINTTLNAVTAYGPGFVDVNKVRYETAVCFGPEGDVAVWPVRDAAEITTDLLRRACRIEKKTSNPLDFLQSEESALRVPAPDTPEILLIGTGKKQFMVNREILKPLLTLGIGVECMTTGAAARTYNVLMHEGRRVIAALLIEEL